MLDCDKCMLDTWYILVSLYYKITFAKIERKPISGSWLLLVIEASIGSFGKFHGKYFCNNLGNESLSKVDFILLYNEYYKCSK